MINPVNDDAVMVTPPYLYRSNDDLICSHGVWHDNIDNQYATDGYSEVTFFYSWFLGESPDGEFEQLQAYGQSIPVTNSMLDKYVKCRITTSETGIGIGPYNNFMVDSNTLLINTVSGNDDVVLLDDNSLIVTPNPFNPTTLINYSIQQDCNVLLDVYNSKGQKVNNLVDDFKLSGNHSVRWNGTDNKNKQLSSGIYFIKLKSGKYTKSRKVVLLK